MAETEYRELSTPEEMKETVETLQSAFTGIPEIEVIPDHIFTAAAKTGILIGAYQGEDQVGFAMGIGDINREDSVYLHAIGVRENHKNESIGEELLREFGKSAEEEGLNQFTLTYDPLLGGNANLNISKAGGTVNTYEKNLYGKQENEANAGETPTDRFEVEFSLADNEVREFLEEEESNSTVYGDIPKALEMGESGERPDLENSAITEDSEENRYNFDEDIFDEKCGESRYLGIEIPRDLSTIKDSGTEEEVRYATRAVFEELINRRNYEVIDFFSSNKDGFSSNTYVLREDPEV